MLKAVTSMAGPKIAESDMRLLARSPLFAGLPTQVLQQAVFLAKLLSLDKKQILFSPEEPAQALFFILEGKIKVYHLNENGEEFVLRVATAGEALCLPSALNRKNCLAHGESIAPSRTLVFPREPFLQLMEKNFLLTQNVLGILASKFERICHKSCMTRMCPAPALVAHFLLERLSKDASGFDAFQNFHINLKPMQLTAQEIGIARETLSRVIRKIEREGLIRFCRGIVIIHDLKGIKELARGNLYQENP
jgi:CRP-like cAMP-binding protein